MPVVPNISITKKTKPFTAACPHWNCFYRTGHKTQELAEADLAIHESEGCMTLKDNTLLDERDERGQQYTKLHHGKSIVEKLWDSLDETLDTLATTKAKSVNSSATMHQRDAEIAELKGHCRGLAISIQMMLPHFYDDVAAVTRQAVIRQKGRQGQGAIPMTPGYKYNPPPMGTKAYAAAQKAAVGDGPAKSPSTGKSSRRSSGQVSRASSGPARQAKSFSQAEADGIRNARDSGLLSAEQLAESFKTTVEQILNL